MYKRFKEGLIDEFARKRAEIILRESSIINTSLFGIKTNEDNIYSKLLNEFDRLALKHVEILFDLLCKEHKVERLPDDSFPTWDKVFINKNGECCAVNFVSSLKSFDPSKVEHVCLRGRKESHYQEIRDEDDSVESCPHIYFVILQKNLVGCARRLFLISSTFAKRGIDEERISFVLFEDFLGFLFGDAEKNRFLEFMSAYKKDFRKAIGYDLAAVCSKEEFEKHRLESESKLLAFDYKQIRSNLFKEAKQTNKDTAKELYNSSFNLLMNNFINNGRYKLMLSNADFATSFLTSEWYFQKYTVSNQLDSTAIVAGYLKSMEQMLWDIVRIVGKGRTIRDVVITGNDQTNVDKTLGALEYFFTAKDKTGYINEDLFVDELGNSKVHVIKYIKQQLAHWRNQTRNGYFHKHILIGADKVIKTREETMFLYFLILGSLKLTDEQIKILFC